MSAFLPLDLIKEVKIRPGIYNKDCLIPPRREHRQQLWMEVAEKLTPKEEWEDYTEEDKETRVSDVASKWRNLRDHFYREVKLIEAGEDNKKRKYIYYDDMQFVRPFIGYKLPPMNKRLNKTEPAPSTLELGDNDMEIDMEDFLKLNEQVMEECRVKSEKETAPESYKRNVALKHSPKAKLGYSASAKRIKNSALNKTGAGGNPSYKISESDISFCLSLVPTLREMSGSRKLNAKIDILKVLHKKFEEIERDRND